jgi:hypothetical protein
MLCCTVCCADNARRALWICSLIYPTVSAVIVAALVTEYAGAGSSSTAWLLYNVWVSVWMLIGIVYFLVSGHRLRRILQPLGSLSAASVARISRFMVGMSLTALSTVVVLLFGSVTGLYWHPWPWAVCTALNRCQELLIAAFMLVALFETKSQVRARKGAAAAAATVQAGDGGAAAGVAEPFLSVDSGGSESSAPPMGGSAIRYESAHDFTAEIAGGIDVGGGGGGGHAPVSAVDSLDTEPEHSFVYVPPNVPGAVGLPATRRENDLPPDVQP